MTERELAENFLAAKTEGSFRLLYRSCSSVFPVVLRVVKNDRARAEEVIQEMWIVAIRKLPEFEWRSSLSTWLISIAINIARKFREHEGPLDLVPPAEEPDVGTRLDLEGGIARLPHGYREVLILHDVEGYKHKEIALMLGISEGTSKSQLFQARKNLRMFLTK